MRLFRNRIRLLFLTYVVGLSHVEALSLWPSFETPAVGGPSG